MAFTKILGPGIHTLANFHSHNINSSGIITATKFVGDMEASSGSTGTFDSLTVTGDLSVVGSLNYTNVTDIYSVGIITAAGNVEVGAGLSVVGISTFVGIATFGSGVGIADSIYHLSDTNTAIRFPDNDTFSVETAGQQNVKVTADRTLLKSPDGTDTTLRLQHEGNSGYGDIILDRTVNAFIIDNDPTNAGTDATYFSVKNKGTENLRINAAGVSTFYGDVTLEAAGANRISMRHTSGGAAVINNPSAASLSFGTNNEEHELTIVNGGKVGIGSSAPRGAIDIWGDGSVYPTLRLGTEVYETEGEDIRFGRTDIGATDIRYHSITSYHHATGSSNYLKFKVHDGGSSPFQSQSTVLTLLGNGKAGFGTDVPDYGLHVYGAGDILIEDHANGSAHLRLRSSNNGTDVSNWKIKTSSDNNLYIENDTAGGASQVTFDPDANLSIRGEYAASQDYPDIQPALDLNFAATRSLDPRITYYRKGVASYIDEYGYLKFVGDNTPRFDHDPDTGECLGLLIEQEASNLLSNTGGTGLPGEDPAAGSNLGNTPTQSIVDDITLPTGKTGSVRRIQFHASGNSGVRYGWTSGGNANNPYSASVWARAVSGTTTVTIDVNDQGNNSYTLTTEWTRMKVTGTTSDAYRFMDLMGNASADAYFWGFQLEYNHHVSSYIPSTPDGGTRYLDHVSITGDEHRDFWNPTEGTYFITYKPNEPAVGDGVIIGSKRAENGTGYPWPLYRHDTSNTNNFKCYDIDSGIISISTAYEDRRESWALGFNGTNGSIVRNGTQVATDNTNMTGLINATELWLGSSSTGSVYSMHVRRFMYYAKRITDTQLITLTS